MEKKIVLYGVASLLIELLESQGRNDYQRAEILLSKNEEIIDGVRKNIKQLSKSYGVLSKNFCFNSNQINILIQDLKLDNQEQPR